MYIILNISIGVFGIYVYKNCSEFFKFVNIVKYFFVKDDK